MANEEHLEILKQGAAVWNEWRINNFEVIPDLHGADLSKANLSEADLSEAILSKATIIETDLSGAFLNRANLSEANLSCAKLTGAFLNGAFLHKTQLGGAILRNAHLRGAKLNRASLIEADLSGADLSGADLQLANLQTIQAVNANFNRATLTGACIEDWWINSATDLEGVICDYIYLKANHDFFPLVKPQERRPHNSNFAPGEFTKLFQEIEDTIDLIFRNGINWKAFAIAFNQINTRILDTNEEGEIFLREYKVLGDGLITLKVTTPPGADRENLREELMSAYQKIVSLEGELKAKTEILAPLYERLLLPGKQMSSDPQHRTILILSANPKGTLPLRLDEEVREIKEGLRRAKVREQFSLVSAEAVRYRDIHRAILDHSPQIIHFSGHGAGVNGLVFEDETGQAKLIDAKALAEMFELFTDQVECIVLNACYSQKQAKAIVDKIGYVVGMSKAIGDKAAIEFAVGFYDALGAGKSIDFAYRLGCRLIRIAGIAENLTPKLLVNPNLKDISVEKKLTSTEPKLDREISDQAKEILPEFTDLSLQAEILKLNNIRNKVQYNYKLGREQAELKGFLESTYGKPININKANFKTILKKFPNITQAEAKAIVSNRPEAGYQSFEDLVNINKGKCPNASWEIIEHLVVFE